MAAFRLDIIDCVIRATRRCSDNTVFTFTEILNASPNHITLKGDRIVRLPLSQVTYPKDLVGFFDAWKNECDCCTSGGSTVPVIFEDSILSTAFPLVFPVDTNKVFLDVDTTSGSVDISSYAPTGMVPGTVFTIRKTDTSQNIIQFNDGVIDYTFVDRPGDHICLYWTGTNFRVI